jgi:hypothetical protein
LGRLQRVHLFAGLAAVALYVVPGLISRAFYPAAFGPAGNWLSDLGNNLMNPRGALFYRLAGVLGGTALLAFFVTLNDPAEPRLPAVRFDLLLVRICGAVAAACFIMTGVFSVDMMPMHSWFSMGNFIAFGTAVALTGSATLSGAEFPRWFAAACFLITAVDVVSGVFGETRWLEWVVVAMLLFYVVVLTVLGLRRSRIAPSPSG